MNHDPGTGRQSGELRRSGGGIACACRGVSHARLREAVTAGASTVEALQSATGAGLECGVCLPILEQLVGVDRWQPATLHASPAAAGVYQVWLTLRGATLPAAVPGQHVLVRMRPRGTQAWVVRPYTVTSFDPGPRVDAFEITIKAVPGGAVGTWLATGVAGDLEVEVSPPRGRFCWPGPSVQAVCFVAGIGVTPALAFARAAAGTRCGSERLHIDWTVRSTAEAVAVHELAVYRASERLTARIRFTSSEPRLGQADVAETVARYPGAAFYVCGPEPYMVAICRALAAAGVPMERIRLESFAAERPSETGTVTMVVAPRPPAASSRSRQYVAGLVVAALALGVVASPAGARLRSAGPPNTGHADLACAECHRDAPGTPRQQLQAWLSHQVGARSAPADVGHATVDNGACVRCHDNPDDRHPVHRFTEPRFAAVRADLGVDRCGSCHAEHRGVRVTLGDGGFCAGCHEATVVEDDPIVPSHEALIADAGWETCLGCHDFHGNHVREVPTAAAEAVEPAAVRSYFEGGPSPYGAAKRVGALGAGEVR